MKNEEEFLKLSGNHRCETVKEYLKRGGKVEKVPYAPDHTLNYFTLAGKNYMKEERHRNPLK